MRRIAMAAGTLVLIAATGGPLGAGLYNTAEAPGVPSRSFRVFREQLIPLRQVGATRDPLSNRCALIAALTAGGTQPALTVEQRLDMSAYLVRMREYRKAVKLLEPIQRQQRDNFLVLSNLATAEQLDGQPLRAVDYLDEAIKHHWPKEWAGLNDAQRQWLEQIGWKEKDFRWYREVETYQLKLLWLRLREPASRANELPENVDEIFGKIHFVGPSGKYEAGKLAPAEKVKLPNNAIEIVEQLLLWMPHDYRLYWLLGELFNSQGNSQEDVASAQLIFDEVAAKWDPPPARAVASKEGAASPNRDNWDLKPRISKPALPTLFKNHLDVLRAQPRADPKIDTGPGNEPLPAALPPTAGSPPADWKSLGIGFGLGVVIAFFGSWQLREVRRRRRPGAVP